MNASPETLLLARHWVSVAESDLTSAEILEREGNEATAPTMCFLSQQCAEKYLKALLTLNSIAFSKTHDLAELLKGLPPSARPGIGVESLSALRPHAVETRYPGDWEPLTLADARQSLEIARQVRLQVRALLPKEALD